MRVTIREKAEGVPMESIGLLAGRLNVLLEGALVRAWTGDALGLTNAVDVFVERVDDAGESNHATADRDQQAVISALLCQPALEKALQALAIVLLTGALVLIDRRHV
jgi:hypothetical protein